MKKLSGILILVVFLISGLKAQESKSDFKPGGKVFGQVFGDYFYKVGSTDVDSLLGGKGEYKKKALNDNAFSLRRVYLGYSYQFTENIAAKVMFESSDGNQITGGKRGLNVKYYYLEWKNFIPNGKLIIGGQSTPTWSRFTEKIWGYRCVEKTIMDFRGLGGSNDLGVSLSGSFDKNGLFGYELMVGNGTGQKVEFNTNKKIYASVHAKLLGEKLLMEVYFDNEKDANDNATSTIKGFVGYQSSAFTVGVEPFQKSYYSGSTQTAAFGTTIFARGQIVKDKLNFMARYDMFNGDVQDVDLTNLDHAYNEGFILAGLDYTPAKNIHFIPNVWINTYSKKSGSPYPDKDADIAARITFFYKF